MLLIKVLFTLLIAFKSVSTEGGFFAENWKLTFSDNGNKTDFIFKTIIDSPNDIWTAFALSTNKAMGSDNILICKYTDATKSSVEHYWSVGYNIQVLDILNETIGISNTKISYEDGVLTCSFSRDKYAEYIDNYFDTNNDHYVLFAHGADSNGYLI
jgi:hypothetical protein